MNRLHHWYCNRPAWAEYVREGLIPDNVGSTDLGDEPDWPRTRHDHGRPARRRRARPARRASRSTRRSPVPGLPDPRSPVGGRPRRRVGHAVRGGEVQRRRLLHDAPPRPHARPPGPDISRGQAGAAARRHLPRLGQHRCGHVVPLPAHPRHQDRARSVHAAGPPSRSGVRADRRGDGRRPRSGSGLGRATHRHADRR